MTARYLLEQSKLREIRHDVRDVLQTLHSLVGYVRSIASDNEGLCFILDQSAKRADEMQARLAAHFGDIMENQQLRILIAEDDPVTLAHLSRVLTEDCGHIVVGGVRAAEDMVCAARDLKPDLALVDVHLAGALDGLAGLQAIDAAGHRVAAVAITGDSDPQLLAKAEAQSLVLGYLLKPVDTSQLRATVRLAWARAQEIRELQDECGSLLGNLEDRKLVDRAKAKLMTDLGITEPAALRALQQEAKANQARLAEFASQVLSGEFVFRMAATRRGS